MPPDTVIVSPAAPRRMVIAVIVAALGVGLPGLLRATPQGQTPASPSPSPSPSLTPEERARDAEREDLEAEPKAEPSASPEPSPTPEASPSPEPSPSPAPVVPSPIPTPSSPPVAPSPTEPPAAPSSSPVAPESAAPSPEPSPEAPAETAPANLLEKLPTFQDIEDIDLTMLLRVTAGEGGTRTADDEPGLVTIVSEEDIRRTGARTVQEVLQTVAGVEVLTDAVGRARIAIRGVPGSLSSGSSENVLVTLNGLRLNESIFGGATAANLDLPVDNVKRIEIVRGAGSVLNGPGALLGVINIVTESVDTFRRDEVTVGGGSFKTFLYNYRYGTTFHDVSLAGFMQYGYTGGARLDIPADAETARDQQLAPLGIPASSLAPGQTVDDRKSLDANLMMAYHHLTLTARLKRENAGGFVGLLDVLGTQNRFEDTQSNLGLEYRRDLPVGSVRGRMSFAESRLTELYDVFPPGFTVLTGPARVVYPGGVLFEERLNSRRLGAEAIYDRPFGPRHTVTAGADVERESTFGLDALTNFDFIRQRPLPSFGSVPGLVPEAARTVSSLYVQDAWNPSRRVGVTGGLRLDHYSDVGSRLQPRVAAVYRFPRDFTLKAGYARGERAPSFLEQLYSSPAFLAASTSPTGARLGFSESDSLDATAIFRRKEVRLSLTGYRTWLGDVIRPDVEGLFLGAPARFGNVHGIHASGVEIEGSRTFNGNRSVELVYAFQHVEDLQTGDRLTGTPGHLGRLSANFGAGKYVILSPSLTIRGERARMPGDPRPALGAYSLVDLVARIHNFHPALELSAVVHDLFGQEYFDPSPFGGLPGDYPRPGRALFVKAKYRF
jgi:outer membrane cobalamin receptor